MMDISRHVDVFDPNKLAGSVGVIGVGAVGSMVALELAKLGIQDLTLVDDDVVEPHNLCNQVLYGPDDVGTKKAEAAAYRIRSMTGYFPGVLLRRWSKAHGKPPFTYLFMCVDSMRERQNLFHDCIRFSYHTKIFLDARINAFAGQVLLIDRENAQQVNHYHEHCLYGDDQVVDTLGSCRTPITIAATAHLASSLMMTLFINHVRGVKPDTNEVLFNTDPWTLCHGKFE